MNIFDRFRFAFRAFVLGLAVIEEADRAWGHDVSEYTPEDSGKYLTSSAAVYSCSTQRAQFLAGLPLRLYKDKGGKRVEVTTGALFDLLHKVNPFWTGTRLIEMTELSLSLWGHTFWFLERGPSGLGTPREIWWGRPDRVRPIPHPEKYIEGYLYTPATGAADIRYEPSEVIWIRYSNPLDEFAPLSPLMPIREITDFAIDAIKSNRQIFVNGVQAGGFITPRKEGQFSEEQAKRMELAIDRRMKGVDKAHRWAVLRADAEIVKGGFTPEQAQFIEGLGFSLEDVCRAYKWPLDLVGGRRTYQNVDAAMKMAYTHAVIPEGAFLAAELAEQLLPMFPGEADGIGFDSSDVEVLQEEKGKAWGREKEQIAAGAITINEWRESKGKKPVPWGDVWWAPATLLPATAGGASDGTQEQASYTDEGGTRGQTRAIEYGSRQHQRIWRAFVRRTANYEKQVSKVTTDLFERQRDSVLDRLKSGNRTIEDAAMEPFDRAKWVKLFRTSIRPVLASLVTDIGQAAIDDLALEQIFEVARPEVAQFLERRAQRFAQKVNETTWAQLKASLNEGVLGGENMPALEDRVVAVMAGRIRSTPETIARTEVIGAANGGTLEAWRQTGVVEEKTWLGSLDDRIRDSHFNAHGQTVPIDEDFVLEGGRGPTPGQIGVAEEDIQCRCTMAASLKRAVTTNRAIEMLSTVQGRLRTLSPNGRHKEGVLL